MREPFRLAPHARHPLPLLCTGRYERLKATVHGVVLGTAAVCALYNFAAWTVRRQRHSAINAALYTAITAWEWVHVQHHLECVPAPAQEEREDETAA
jgi:hypothetical protein